MDDVRGWLSKKPRIHVEGVRIYLKYNRAPFFIALFQEEETEFKRNKLIELMQGLLVKNEAPPTTPTEIISHQVKTVGPRSYKGWPKEMDPVLMALWDQWRPAYAEMMHLQAQVYPVAMEGGKGNPYMEMEAGRMALRILDLDDECDSLYAQRDYYLKNGFLAEKRQEKPVIADPAVAYREMKNAERYIRDYKVKLAKDPGNKNAPKWQQRLKEYQEAVAGYRKQLKLDDE